MSVDIELHHPVEWPTGRPKEGGHKQALWKEDGRQLSFAVAERRLGEQVNAITKRGRPWRTSDCRLSTNVVLAANGRPHRGRAQPLDPSVAFYFKLDGEPHVLACDRFDRVEDNIAAIAAHIEALRGQERWGVADMKQAFAGHVALPAPEQWWQVLGVSQHATAEEIDRAYRAKAKDAHPDREGGSQAAMARLNQAREEGKRR